MKEIRFTNWSNCEACASSNLLDEVRGSLILQKCGDCGKPQERLRNGRSYEVLPDDVMVRCSYSALCSPFPQRLASKAYVVPVCPNCSKDIGTYGSH